MKKSTGEILNKWVLRLVVPFLILGLVGVWRTQETEGLESEIWYWCFLSGTIYCVSAILIFTPIYHLFFKNKKRS